MRRGVYHLMVKLCGLQLIKWDGNEYYGYGWFKDKPKGARTFDDSPHFCQLG